MHSHSQKQCPCHERNPGVIQLLREKKKLAKASDQQKHQQSFSYSMIELKLEDIPPQFIVFQSTYCGTGNQQPKLEVQTYPLEFHNTIMLFISRSRYHGYGYHELVRCPQSNIYRLKKLKIDAHFRTSHQRTVTHNKSIRY